VSTPETLVIQSSDLRAEIAPSLGGGLARFEMIKGEAALPVFRPWPKAGTNDPNQLASYVLLPWSNRISSGGFDFEGRFHALEPNFPGEPCPLHGNGWTSEWRLIEHFDDKTTLALTSDGPGPFRYEASLAYEMELGCMTMRLSVKNRAELTLPFGLGFHPWLPRTERTQLYAPVQKVWLEDARHLPTECISIEDSPEWDFSRSRRLPQGWINNGFVGWSSKAEIIWPERGLVLTIEASRELSTYLVYSPGATADFFCFEPVSHSVDAHNLPGGPAANGLKVLAPGESFEAACRFMPRITVGRGDDRSDPLDRRSESPA